MLSTEYLAEAGPAEAGTQAGCEERTRQRLDRVQRFKMTLTMLGPVHVGSGQMLGPMDYVVRQEKDGVIWFYAIDAGRILGRHDGSAAGGPRGRDARGRRTVAGPAAVHHGKLRSGQTRALAVPGRRDAAAGEPARAGRPGRQTRQRAGPRSGPPQGDRGARGGAAQRADDGADGTAERPVPAGLVDQGGDPHGLAVVPGRRRRAAAGPGDAGTGTSRPISSRPRCWATACSWAAAKGAIDTTDPHADPLRSLRVRDATLVPDSNVIERVMLYEGEARSRAAARADVLRRDLLGPGGRADHRDRRR